MAKPIVHDFGEKIDVFSCFVFIKNGSRKLFGDVLDKIKPLKSIKTSASEKGKIRIFPNGLVHGFGQKFKISSTLIFMQNRPRKSIWERSS